MKRDSWGSKLGFTLAVAGSAVGLANIWRFPYIVGKHGGAAFILVYILCLAAISFPVFIAEILIGRKTQTSPSGAYRKLGGSEAWSIPGKMTILTGFIVSAFYSTVAGWILGYLVEAARGSITHFESVAQSSIHFQSVLADSWWGLTYHFFFILICSAILYFGVRNGIERSTKVMMPLLFIMLFILVFKGLTMPNAESALYFLFRPDWSLITPGTVVVALGQAFFTLSLGQGTMVTYGSYLKRNTNIITTCIPIVLIDLLVSIFSAIAVFTIVFSAGIEPDSGPGLIFNTLPWVFSQLPGGYFVAIAFFLLVTLAAITSEISAMEPTIAYLRDERGWGRHASVWACGFGAFLLGVPCALSYSIFKGITLFNFNILDFMDFLCSSLLIPLGGLFAVVLVGWKWGVAHAMEHLKEGSGGLLHRYPLIIKYFSVSIKYIAPFSIIVIFLHAIGVF